MALLATYLVGGEAENGTCAGMLVTATGLSFLTFIKDLPLWLTRTAAVFTVVLMFFFFSSFFQLVPTLGADWYRAPGSLTSLSFLLGAFLMIPLMSEFSCRLKKADCPRRKQRGVAARGFFTVPDKVQKQLS